MCIMHCQKYIYYKCTRINKVFLTYLIWTVMHTHIQIYDRVCDNEHWQHLLYLQQCRQVTHHKQFYVLKVVYPQMATNTTGKVNLGQEGKPSYYNCVLHVYALIKKIWKFNEKCVIQNWWRVHQSSFYLYRWRNPFTLTYKRKR